MTEWTLDAAHANVEFSIKHMMITTIRGRFQELSLDVVFDEQAPERSSVVPDRDREHHDEPGTARRPSSERRLPRFRALPGHALREHGNCEAQ